MGKYEEIQGITFIDTKVIRDRGYRQDMLLGIQKHDELRINSPFSLVEGGVLSIEDMEEYQVTKERIIAELIQEENPITKRVTENDDGTITVQEPSSDSFNKDLPNNQKFRDELKNSLFVEELGDLHAYYMKLYEPQAFYDQAKHEFQRFILVCFGEYEQQFHFSQEYLNVKGYSVKGLVSSATFIILDWIAHDMPILFVRFSEAEAFHMTNHVLDSNKIVLIRDKVMKRMIYDYRSFFKRFTSQLAEEKALTKSYEMKSSKLFQLLQHHTASTFRGETIDQAPPRGVLLRIYAIVLLSLGWLFAIIFLILYLFAKGVF